MLLPDHVLRCMKPEDRAKLGKAGVTMKEAVERSDKKAEAELQSDIAQYLRLLEIEFDRPPMNKRSNRPAGWPDFVLAYKGVPVGLEAKTILGKLSPDQTKRHEAMRRNGWTIVVVRSLADVQQTFRAIDQEQGL